MYTIGSCAWYHTHVPCTRVYTWPVSPGVGSLSFVFCRPPCSACPCSGSPAPRARVARVCSCARSAFAMLWLTAVTLCAAAVGTSGTFADMSDGDEKTLTFGAENLVIKPFGNNETWTVTSKLDRANCSALIDFNVPPPSPTRWPSLGNSRLTARAHRARCLASPTRRPARSRALSGACSPRTSRWRTSHCSSPTRSAAWRPRSLKRGRLRSVSARRITLGLRPWALGCSPPLSAKAPERPSSTHRICCTSQ